MIYAISDLHLGDRGTRDNFHVGNREQRFNNFLDHVSKDQLIICGDLLDLWTTNFSRAYRANSLLLRRLRDKGAIYIPGNHDNLLDVNDRWPWEWCPIRCASYRTSVAGKSFEFIHGHEVDSTCNSLNPGIGNITAIISGLLEDMHGAPTHNGEFIEEQFIGGLEKALRIFQHKDRSKELLDKVEAFRTTDVLVYGHTHAPGSHNGCFNAGCWVRDDDTFVQIDNDGNVSVQKWLGNTSIPYEVQL